MTAALNFDSAHRRKGCVLVVDDDERNRLLMGSLLDHEGYCVTLACNGQEALQGVASKMPDVVLLDVIMPDMDGYAVCRAIRQNPCTATIPVLMVTALTERKDRLAGIEAGANDFLTKPIDADEIRLRVRNAVYAKHLFDQNREDLRRLQELEGQRDRLVHMIAHDMRSPLAVLLMTLDLIDRRTTNEETSWRNDLNMARKASRGLDLMIASMLDVSRLESGQFPLARVRHAVLSICHEAAQAVATSAREKNLAVRVTGVPGTASVDYPTLQRVVVNLLGNAIKFSPAGKPVTVTVSSEAGMVRVEVRDEGRGIAPDDQGRIFEKFGQVQARTPDGPPGYGLGLTFCKLAIEAHGGRIGVDSQVGAGSTFWFTVPEVPPVALSAP